MKTYFDYEKLNAYQTSLKFVSWAEMILEKIPRNFAAWSQLDRASTSVPLNIAEGNGKFTSPDRCRFFDNARGSALECAGCLNVLVAKRKLEGGEIVEGKEMLQQVVSMLVGLIKSNSATRLHENALEYGS
jgi:four helix bundle protein